jgi:hypothetical protein
MMESRDLAGLERLHTTMRCSKAATVAWRELLVESLGDRMCGSGLGPTQDEIDTLASLDEAQQRASENYTMFLASVSLKRSTNAWLQMRASAGLGGTHIDPRPRDSTS